MNDLLPLRALRLRVMLKMPHAEAQRPQRKAEEFLILVIGIWSLVIRSKPVA